MRILHVAEKNDVAKNVAAVLSDGVHRKHEGLSRFNKVYEFRGPFRGEQGIIHRVTSTSGHILNFAFPETHKNWNLVDPVSLFDAPVSRICTNELSSNIKKTLEREIKFCEILVIWTDCDREGEAIGFEILDICKLPRRNIDVFRARFSDMTAASIKQAFASLARLNPLLNDSVLTRSELDLRIGAAFTRLQTLKVGRAFPGLQRNILSYGSCQFPTLGFVVERYKAIEGFRSEFFYRLSVSHEAQGKVCDFSWERNRIFDHSIAFISYERILERPIMTVRYIENKPKSKLRPYPMNTVALEKLASRKLQLTAKEVLQHAEKLYTGGLISYPRTETTCFPGSLSLKPLVQEQTKSRIWGNFASKIIHTWRGPNPRNGGKSDEAHPPIYPTKYADLSHEGNKGRVYELIVRHFLACVSEDAKGLETIVQCTVSDEVFEARGLQIKEKNFLEVYIYETWYTKTIPNYELYDCFIPTKITLNLMPGRIGMALISGYDDLGFGMSKPHLRASLERELKQITEGLKSRSTVLSEQISTYRSLFVQLVRSINRLEENMAFYLGEQPIR